MQVLDNINKTVRDDLVVTIQRGSKVSIAAACFSIYAYQTLKKQLDSVAEVRFIFTSPRICNRESIKRKTRVLHPAPVS